jgi:hypothetical protein
VELEFAQSIFSNFGLKESIVNVKRIESGLINSTFIVNSKTNSYILQAINTSILTNYEDGLENILTIGNCSQKEKLPLLVSSSN